LAARQSYLKDGLVVPAIPFNDVAQVRVLY